MRIVLMRAWMCGLAVFLGLAWTAAEAAPLLAYRIVAKHPHDPTAFTEGLAIDNGRLFESTGLSGQSKLTIRELASGRVLKSADLDPRDFGEGLAVVGKRIVQLTWTNGVGYVYDLDLKRTGSFPLSSEGWGLAYDGKRLVRSDGTAVLRFLDSHTFSETGNVGVHDGAQAITRLNELEFADGVLYANVWLTDWIAAIDPRDGSVSGWLDLSDLKKSFPKPANWNEQDYVLNGIAFNPATGTFLVTGKCWPFLFEIAVKQDKKSSQGVAASK